MELIEEKINISCLMAFGVTIEQLKSNERKMPLPDIRHIVFYYLRKETRLSLSQIGKILNRDHASVIHGIKKVKNYIDIGEEKTIQRLSEFNPKIYGFTDWHINTVDYLFNLNDFDRDIILSTLNKRLIELDKNRK